MRAIMIVSSTLSIAMICAIGCSDIGQPIEAGNPSGQFTYTGYDLNGQVLLTGTMILQRQGNWIIGARNLKFTTGVLDSGSVGGTVIPNGTFEAIFDPTKVPYAYTSIVGTEWPTNRTIAGEVFSSSGTADWSVKIGTFKLSPMD